MIFDTESAQKIGMSQFEVFEPERHGEHEESQSVFSALLGVLLCLCGKSIQT